jgi:Mg-chelatase subunit ChlD
VDRTIEEHAVSPLTFAMTQATTDLRESLRLLDLPETWVVVLVVLPALALVSWLGYRKERLSPTARATLATLRFLALAILMAVIFRPVKVTKREEVQKAQVLVLVDDSASMQRRDSYAGDSDQRAALGRLGIVEPAQATRTQIAQAVFEKSLAPRLASGDYEARLYTFSSALEPWTGSTPLAGRGPTTQPGDALAEALALHRGRHVTDIVLISDGRQNAGLPAEEAARSAAAAGIPIHTVVIGDTRPEKNLVIELVEAPPTALEGDEIEISVRVLARGVERAGTALVKLEEYDPESNVARRVLTTQDVGLQESGERATLVARAGPADRRTQQRLFRVEVAPLEGETLLDDNALEVSVHVSPQKVRVLYVEGYPRWEYRRLALDMLKRADENIEFRAFLLSANSDFLQESSAGLEPLRAVPTDRKELLDNYDVVILGDVNPFAISPDPRRCDDFMKALVEFVERGGGLCFLAGEYDLPKAYLDTPLAQLFPVIFDDAELRTGAGDLTREFHPRLEDSLNPHEIVRLHPELETNRELWEEESGLQGMYFYVPVHRAKPGSQVLLRHPFDANAYGNHPLAVAGYYPSGRTLFLAVDETWRFLYHFGPRYHQRFWRNAIRWLALGRMKSGDRRYRLELARTQYDLGERVAVEARVLDSDYRPSSEPTQVVHWSTPEGSTTELTLTSSEGRPGVYRGSLEPARTGLYRVWIEAESERVASTEFEVVLPSLENRDPAPSPQELAALSTLSRGKAVDPKRMDELLAELPGNESRADPISARLDDIWDRWPTLLAALVVLSIEWILRKRFELV